MPPANPATIDSQSALKHVMKLMGIVGKSGQEGKVADYVTRALLKGGAHLYKERALKCYIF